MARRVRFYARSRSGRRVLVSFLAHKTSTRRRASKKPRFSSEFRLMKQLAKENLIPRDRYGRFKI